MINENALYFTALGSPVNANTIREIHYFNEQNLTMGQIAEYVALDWRAVRNVVESLNRMKRG